MPRTQLGMLYIHIGPPKTGTTTLQQFLAQHAGALQAHGLLYPDAGLSHRGKHHGLRAELRHPQGLGGPGWAALRALRAAHPGQAMLISEEAFYDLDPAELARLPAAAGEGPVTVLVYFRDHASHAASLYAQGMKLARGLDEGEMLGTRAGNDLLDFDGFFERYMAKPSHFEVIARWAAVFGWGAIRLRPYRRDLLVGGDIIEDLLDALGLSLAQLGVRPTPDANSAPGWKSLETLRAVWQALEGLPGGVVDGRIPLQVRNLCREAVEAAFAGSDARTEYLSLAQRERCAEATRRDLAALAAHLPPSSFAYPLAPVSGERPFTPGVEQVPGAELARVIAQLALAAGTAQAEAKGLRKGAGKHKGKGKGKDKDTAHPDDRAARKREKQARRAAGPQAEPLSRTA